jgi:hypothetical protein
VLRVLGDAQGKKSVSHLNCFWAFLISGSLMREVRISWMIQARCSSCWPKTYKVNRNSISFASLAPSRVKRWLYSPP